MVKHQVVGELSEDMLRDVDQVETLIHVQEVVKAGSRVGIEAVAGRESVGIAGGVWTISVDWRDLSGLRGMSSWGSEDAMISRRRRIFMVVLGRAMGVIQLFI